MPTSFNFSCKYGGCLPAFNLFSHRFPVIVHYFDWTLAEHAVANSRIEYVFLNISEIRIGLGRRHSQSAFDASTART